MSGEQHFLVPASRVAQLQAAEARAAELTRLLENLTPGGSEFAGDPQRCAKWVREEISRTIQVAVEAAAARNKATERVADLESLLRVARQHQETAELQAKQAKESAADYYARQRVAEGKVDEIKRQLADANKVAQAKEMAAAEAMALVMGQDGQIEQLVQERDAAVALAAQLREALEAGQRVYEHLDTCHDCGLGDWCEEYTSLELDAKRLSAAALALTPTSAMQQREAERAVVEAAVAYFAPKSAHNWEALADAVAALAARGQPEGESSK